MEQILTRRVDIYMGKKLTCALYKLTSIYISSVKPSRKIEVLILDVYACSQVDLIYTVSSSVKFLLKKEFKFLEI